MRCRGGRAGPARAASPRGRHRGGARHRTRAGRGRRVERGAGDRLSHQRGPGRARGGPRLRHRRRADVGLPALSGGVSDRRDRGPAPARAARDRGRDGEPTRAALCRDRRGRARGGAAAAGAAPGKERPVGAAAALGAGRDARPLRDSGELLGGRLERDREHRLLPRPLRRALLPARRGGVEPGAPTAHADRRRDRDGCVCRDRDRPVLRSRPLLQPGAVRRQPAPCLFPGQLDLFRPEHLRPLPRPRPDGDGRVRGVGQGSP